MATLVKQTVIRDGLDATYVSANSGGDEFVNTSREFIHIKNTSEVLVFTIVTQQTVDGEAVADKTVTVNAPGEQLIGPFPKSVYNDGDGKVQLTYDDTTAVTIAILELTED